MNILERFTKISYGENFSFSPFSEDDITYYLKWFTSQKIRWSLSPKTPKTEEGIRQWLKKNLESEKDYYSIIKVDNQIIGHAGIKDIDVEKKTAELSCVIGDEETIGTGMGIKAMMHFLKYVFNIYDFESIYILREKRRTGENFFLKLGLTLEHDERYDRYTLSRKKFEEMNAFSVRTSS